MRVLSVLIFFFLLLNVHAQQTKDSALKLLLTAKADTNKVKLLIEIANYYEANNQDSSIYFLEKAKLLSESLGYGKGLYQYNERSAIVSFTKGNYSLAMEQSKLALDLARQLKDSSLVINMLNNIGIVYSYLGEFDEQLNYTLQAKKAIEEKRDSTRLSAVYHNVANCYNNLKQYRRSIEYALISVKIAVQYKKKNDYINRVYATLAQNYEALQLMDSALFYYNKAIKSSVELNDKYAEAAIYGYVTNLYANQGQFDKMLIASERSLLLARALQSRQMVASALYNVAYANYFDGNNVKAKGYINEALEIATRDTLREELKNTYSVLSYIAAGDKDYATSVWAKRKSDSIQEAVLNEQVIKSTTELEQKYESAKKDKRIILQQSQLHERRILNYVFIGSALILLIISLLSYRNYRQKRKLQQQRINELETEKQLTATEAVLEGEEHERTRLAKDLHDGLGGMLSGIKYSFLTMKRNLVMTPENQQAFERSMDMLDSSIHEMRRVAHNMMPEALLKFGLDTALKDLCNDINQTGALHMDYQSIGMQDAVIDQTTSISIYRIVQELINNTMKHSAATNSILQLSKIGSKLTITVEDDGRGFDPASRHMSKGIGWINIMNRVEILKGKLDINSQPGKGTSVLIEMNLA